MTTTRGLRLAHSVIDLIHALDLAQTLNTPDAHRAVATAAQGLVDAGLFDVVISDNGRHGLELRPFLEAVALPALVLTRRLGAATGHPLDEVLADLRHALETTRDGTGQV